MQKLTLEAALAYSDRYDAKQKQLGISGAVSNIEDILNDMEVYTACRMNSQQVDLTVSDLQDYICSIRNEIEQIKSFEKEKSKEVPLEDMERQVFVVYRITTGTKLALLDNVKKFYQNVRENGEDPLNISGEESIVFDITDDVKAMGKLRHFLQFSKANTPEEKAQVLEGVIGILEGEEWEPLTFEEEERGL